MRNIYIVNATQVVTSDAHPEGLYSVMTGYPKTFDTINFDNDEDKTLRMAKAAYLSQLATNYSVDNRAMTTVTLERADGRQFRQLWYGIAKESCDESVLPDRAMDIRTR